MLTVERRVSHEGMISVGGNLYSVPDATRRRTLEVQNHLKDFASSRMARGSRSTLVLEGKNQRRLDPGHRRPPPPAIPPGPEAAPVGVGVRPLSLYDAVARRLASGSAAS